jgi:hypothetical protein
MKAASGRSSCSAGGAHEPILAVRCCLATAAALSYWSRGSDTVDMSNTLGVDFGRVFGRDLTDVTTSEPIRLWVDDGRCRSVERRA